MCTFFFAGTDTTASAISSLIHKLIEHKGVEEKLREEIK
jgi:cytochrome P450